MSYRRSLSLSWLVLAIVVLLLVNLQAAAAQPDIPRILPIDNELPSQPVTPEKMTFQPDSRVDNCSEFLPPRTRVRDFPLQAEGQAKGRVAPQRNHALRFENGRFVVKFSGKGWVRTAV